MNPEARRRLLHRQASRFAFKRFAASVQNPESKIQNSEEKDNESAKSVVRGETNPWNP
jgi:hypothetical protein